MLARRQGGGGWSGGGPAAGRAPARASAGPGRGRARRRLGRRSGASPSFRPVTVAIRFDTHRFVKNLMRNGFSERQAEALAEERAALLHGSAATKADLEKVRWSLVKWMFGAAFGLAGLIVALG